MLNERKVRGRVARTSRFFGEAVMASQTPHREVYYGSFKWLTTKRFAGNLELADEHQRRAPAQSRSFGRMTA